MRVIGISEQDPYPRAGLGLLADDPLQLSASGNEQTRVHEYADVVAAGIEERSPCISRDVGEMRVDPNDLALGHRSGALSGYCGGEQVGLVPPESCGQP